MVIKRLATKSITADRVFTKEPAHENFTHLPPLSRSR